jgi:hypothetical protein
VLVGICGGSALGAPARPDLVEAALTVSPRAGGLVVADVVRNRGPAAAPRSTTSYAFNGVVRRRAVPPLAPRQASRGTVSVALAAGSYRVVVCADAARHIAETSERDNCRVARGTVRGGDASPPLFAGLESAVTCIPGPAGGPTRSSSYELRWPAATDDATPAERIVYDVYQANAPGGEDFGTPTYTTPPGATSFATPPLPDDRSYYFVVRARDAAGNRDRNTVERLGHNLCV